MSQRLSEADLLDLAVSGVGSGNRPPGNQEVAGGGTLDRVLALLQRPPTAAEGLSDAASAVGAYGQGEKSNRLTEAELQQAYDRMMLENQQAQNRFGLDAAAEARATRGAAMRNLPVAQYIAGGGAGDYKPSTIMGGGQSHQLPGFSFAPKAATPEAMATAGNLVTQLTGDLSAAPAQWQGGFTPRDVSEYAKPGMGERVSSWGATGLGALAGLQKMGALDWLKGLFGGGDDAIPGGLGNLYRGTPQTAAEALGAAPGGAISNITGLAGTAGGIGGLTASGLLQGTANPLVRGSILAGVGPQTSAMTSQGVSQGIGAAGGGSSAGGAVMSNLLGKALPIAGIAHGGYNLVKGGGVGSNILSGAETGAGIGTLVMPGIGTAVGAGIGAIVGGLRSFIGHPDPSKAELAGRTAAKEARQLLISDATPEQRAAAQAAGWEDPNGALLVVSLQDKLGKTGMSGQQADQMAQRLYTQLWEAEKSGPQAVQQVLTQIQQLLGGGQV